MYYLHKKKKSVRISLCDNYKMQRKAESQGIVDPQNFWINLMLERRISRNPIEHLD